MQLSYLASSYDSSLPFVPVASYLLLYIITLFGLVIAKRLKIVEIYKNAFKRFYISLCVIAGCTFFMALGMREISFVIFTFLLVTLLLWIFSGNYEKECRILTLTFIVFAMSPYDLRVSNPYASTDKRESYVGWLDVHYGLMMTRENRNESQTERGYPMGCLVPVYPLSKVFYIDIWPTVDTFFDKFKRDKNA
jgi:hypothetical protein